MLEILKHRTYRHLLFAQMVVPPIPPETAFASVSVYTDFDTDGVIAIVALRGVDERIHQGEYVLGIMRTAGVIDKLVGPEPAEDLARLRNQVVQWSIPRSASLVRSECLKDVVCGDLDGIEVLVYQGGVVAASTGLMLQPWVKVKERSLAKVLALHEDIELRYQPDVAR